MTIEEKAEKEYPAVSPLDYPITHDYNIAAKNGFIEGAEWMIENAIKWLQEHVNDYLFNDGTAERPWLKCKSDMFDNFKKAMEE